ncbi:MAG TPA: hypothetical protein VFZ00_11250 [Solirubrobacter sp.]|nr:hypothetical protein [Solirubrobacter sp.]
MPILAFPLASPLGSEFSFVPGGGDPAALGQTSGGSTDMLIDPVTLDYVRTSTGEWAETADSRTTMMIMLELELGASPFDPLDGTTIAARRRDGDPVTTDEIEAEALRVGEFLRRAGIIADFSATTTDAAGRPLTDSAGRTVVALSWRDLASGSPVDLAIQG